jgi:hypothetical protein
LHHPAEFVRPGAHRGVFPDPARRAGGLRRQVDLRALRHHRQRHALEFSNTTPLPAKIYANEGACQFLFLQGNEPCEVSYRDKAGKYQGQRGVTLPKI